MYSDKPHVIVLIGATASGKTELAIEIAQHFKTRIHTIDSRQIYKFMIIGLFFFDFGFRLGMILSPSRRGRPDFRFLYLFS